MLTLGSAAVALVLSSCTNVGHYGYGVPRHRGVVGHASTVAVFGGNNGFHNRGFIAPRGAVFQRPLVVQQPVFGRSIGLQQNRHQRVFGQQVSHRYQQPVQFRDQRPVQRGQRPEYRQQSLRPNSQSQQPSRGRSQQPSGVRGMTMASYQTRTPAAAGRPQSQPVRGMSASRGQSPAARPAAPIASREQVRNPRGR